MIWKRTDTEHALTVGEFVFVDDPDIDIDNLPHTDEWNLIIRNVQPRHRGIYECQISTKEDLRRYVQLNVIGMLSFMQYIYIMLKRIGSCGPGFEFHYENTPIQIYFTTKTMEVFR